MQRLDAMQHAWALQTVTGRPAYLPPQGWISLTQKMFAFRWFGAVGAWKGRRQRVVPLGSNAVKYLKEYLEKVRPRHAKKNPKERKLFLSIEGKTLTWDAIKTKLFDYRKKAGINHAIGLHMFRRSCATHMLQQGADILYIQKLLGHKYLRTTQQYIKVMPVEVKNTHKKTHPNTGKEDKEDDD